MTYQLPLLTIILQHVLVGGDDDLSTSSGDDLSSSGEGTEEASEIELAYAHALGESVASYFLGKRLIFQTIYGGILAWHENISLDQFLGYFFDDITTQMIDDVVRRALIATDFDSMDITQEIMDDLLDHIGNVFELMAENPNDPKDIAATNILWDLERLLAKALKEGCDDVIKKSLEEEFFYDGFFDSFSEDFDLLYLENYDYNYLYGAIINAEGYEGSEYDYEDNDSEDRSDYSTDGHEEDGTDKANDLFINQDFGEDVETLFK